MEDRIESLLNYLARLNEEFALQVQRYTEECVEAMRRYLAPLNHEATPEPVRLNLAEIASVYNARILGTQIAIDHATQAIHDARAQEGAPIPQACPHGSVTGHCVCLAAMVCPVAVTLASALL